MRLSLFFLGALILLIPSVQSQSAELDIEGTCQSFNATVSLQAFGPGCYDVKIDVTSPEGRVGEIFNPRQGWTSSFFYVKEGICITEEQANETANATYELRTPSSPTQMTFTGRVRQDARVWDTNQLTFTQDCPPLSGLPGDSTVFLTAALVMLIILIGIVLYVKVLR